MSEKIVSRVCEAIQFDLNRSVSTVVSGLSDICESPIEILFLSTLVTGLMAANMREFGSPAYWKIKIKNGTEIGQASARLIIAPQFQWNSYRIDFAIYFEGDALSKGVFIECDGHDFHERTPEQAERDRRKDREIQAAGIRVLRFTGREIWRDPIKCVIEAIEAVRSK